MRRVIEPVPCRLVGAVCWLGTMLCIIWWCPSNELIDKLSRFTLTERFVLLRPRLRLLRLLDGVPTLATAWGDNPELSVVGADGFDDVLWDTKSLPPLPTPTDVPDVLEVLFEHLRHFGSHECRWINFLYSFRTCNQTTHTKAFPKAHITQLTI